MPQRISNLSLIVPDYDEAITFYCNVLGFELVEDTWQPEQNKRWVVVRPSGGEGTAIVLAQASKSGQGAFIGNQAGGRVFLFLATDDFSRDYDLYRSRGVEFVRAPQVFDYGKVAVFKDLYGNLWDLLEFSPGHPFSFGFTQ